MSKYQLANLLPITKKRKGMRHTFLLAAIAGLAVSVAAVSCNKFKGDVEVPAYLHLDRIDIVPQAQNAPSVEPGFYTSIIDAVQLICWFEGDEAETTLGVFQLPCTVPVLKHGKAAYVRVVPVVKQDGIAGTRIAYPYYQTITLNDVRLAPDSVTNLGRYDSANEQWYLQGHYFTREHIEVLCEDYFEPTSFTTNFDSTVTWVRNDPENACSGQGYALFDPADSLTVATLTLNTVFSPAATKILYLEMDYKTDMDLYIVMLGHTVSNSSTASTKSVMTLYPNSKWQKIYINLGRTWSQFNYNTPIRIFFQTANPDHKEGKVMLDNVKVITI